MFASHLITQVGGSHCHSLFSLFIFNISLMIQISDLWILRTKRGSSSSLMVGPSRHGQCCFAAGLGARTQVPFFPVQFSSVAQCVRLFATPWTAARQASPSITNSQSLLKLMTIESVMPSNHLIPFSSTFNLSQHQGLSQRVSSSHQVARVLEFQLQHQSCHGIFRTALLQDGLVGSAGQPWG